jgi:hypothetical protein
MSLKIILSKDIIKIIQQNYIKQCLKSPEHKALMKEICSFNENKLTKKKLNISYTYEYNPIDGLYWVNWNHDDKINVLDYSIVEYNITDYNLPVIQGNEYILLDLRDIGIEIKLDFDKFKHSWYNMPKLLKHLSNFCNERPKHHNIPKVPKVPKQYQKYLKYSSTK